MSDLASILDEEISVIEDEDDPDVRKLTAPMRRALDKVQADNRTLTKLEKEAVQYALDDIGELYLYAGTSAGFNKEDVDSLQYAHQHAQNAFDQARLFGVTTRAS